MDSLDMMRLLASAEDGDGEHFGVHISYSDLYYAILFLAAIYAGGIMVSRFMSMPALVGEIFIGVVFGPSVLNLVPGPESFVLLGEIGLILLVLEAGIDIDLQMLKLIGSRGIAIAVVGSFLPILIAFGVALLLGYSHIAALAVGCSFAPTSLGIAMNVLRQSNIVNTPVGQLVVAAAIIDDMVALVILSQLQAFASDGLTIVEIFVPVLSAMGFLSIGGALAVFVLPGIIDKIILRKAEVIGLGRGWASLFIMFSLLLALMPMTYYGKASPLMGAFLAGLTFCSNQDAHHMFVDQLKRVMQWLLRIFFAASIGFQVPIRSFASGSVFGHGALFALALVGKLVTGLMVPNFARTRRFSSTHLRDCLVVGFSMMAEGEFAFVIAVFCVTHGMLTKPQYASVVLAVLISTILAPFCLRFTVGRFNKGLEKTLKEASADRPASQLEVGLRNHTALFFCIQTKSKSSWGLQMAIMDSLSTLGLEVIDHRSWHDRHSDRNLINEMYVQDSKGFESGSDPYERDRIVTTRVSEISLTLTSVIGQADAVVRAERWIPTLPEGCFDAPKTLPEQIVLLATARLEKRMNSKEALLGENYVSMDDKQQANASPLGDPEESDQLESTFNGRLEGFFRRDGQAGDQPMYRPYQSVEGVELLPTRDATGALV